MNIAYISNSRIPTEKAYGVSVVKTCEALAKKGNSVTLLSPKVNNTAGVDVFSYYGIQRNFSLRHIPTLDVVSWSSRYGFLVNQISFAFAVLFLYRGNKKKDIVITRDEISGWLLGLRGFRVFYDMHGFPERHLWFLKIILKKITGIIATNDWKKDQCQTQFHIPKEKIVVARNGFDPAFFSVSENPETLRKNLGLPSGRPTVLYTGHLYDWKGVYVLAETARLMRDVNFVFVGGTYYHLADFKERYKDVENIILVGQKSHKEIPRYLKSADVLVLPNSAKGIKDSRFSVYSQYDTSPIKLFEYMASEQSIVASDLPSIREILNDKNAILVPSDSTEGLKAGIQKLINDKELSRHLAEKALRDVQQYTWERRAEKISAFIKQF